MSDAPKLSLTKSAPRISLDKQTRALDGELVVSLTWNQRQGGGLFRRRQDVDLDLACLYELADGRKGVVQALGSAFTSANDGAPIIRLDGDDRSGGGGETMRIDLSRLGELRRVLVFAYIYQGTPSWAAADGVVTMTTPTGQDIEVRLDEADDAARTCAIALLSNDAGALGVQREVRYVGGMQRELDAAYAWGLSWTSGRK